MAVPFNDTRRRFATLSDQMAAAWSGIVDSGRYIGGPAVSTFEKTFADYCGADHCIGVANGTDALELALRSCQIEAGQEVITTPNAGGYTTAACHILGALPTYADVDPTTSQMDVGALHRYVTSQTRAIVVTHLYGLMIDVRAVRAAIAELGRQDVVVIEDCAQAHGARIGGELAGTIGDVATFSFYPTKNLGGIGDSGALLCKNAELAGKIRSLAQYGWGKKYQVGLRGGRNSRMDPIQAAILTQQLPTLDQWNVKRRNICSQYQQALPLDWTLISKPDDSFVGHLAVAVAPTESSRRRAQQKLSELSIGHDVHYPVLDYRQPAWCDSRSSCPNAERLVDRILSLPCFPELLDGEINEVIDAIRSFG